MNGNELKQRPSKFFILIDFLKSRLGTVLIASAIGVGAFLYFDPALPEVPRRAKLVFYSFAFLTPVGYWVGQYIVSLLYDPNLIWLADIDARRLDGALYAVPYADFKEFTVVDEDGNANDQYDITRLTPQLYVGKAVDLDEMTVEGTWRGTLDDRELARSLQKVRECRNQLEEDAKRGFVIETSAFTIVRNAARAATLDVVEAFKQGSLPDNGDSLNAAVDDALEDYGLEEEIDNDLMPDELDAEEASTRLEDLADDADAPGDDENGRNPTEAVADE
jgi:hypothetical protein